MHAPARVFRRADTYFTWKPAADGVRVAFGEGGNTLVLVMKDAALLVDTKNAPFGERLRLEAEAEGKRVTTLVNTHHHADHTAGNWGFLPRVRWSLAHTNAAPRITSQIENYKTGLRNGLGQLARSENPQAKAVLEALQKTADSLADLGADRWTPTERVEDRREFEVEGEPVVLVHFGPGHTDNDLVVHLPRKNVVHTGDLLFHKNHPFIDRAAGATTEGWVKSLRQIIDDLCNGTTVVVPGHGELTDRAGLQGQIDYFERTREAVAKAIKDGKSRDEVSQMTVEPFADYGFQQMRPRTLGAIYDELTATSAAPPAPAAPAAPAPRR